MPAYYVRSGDAGFYELGNALRRQLEDQFLADSHGENPVAHAEGVRVHALRPDWIRRLGHRADTEGPGEFLEWICHLHIVPVCANVSANPLCGLNQLANRNWCLIS